VRVLVKRIDDPASFLAAVEPVLLEDEARHNLLLGIAGTLRDRPGLYPEHRLWSVERDATIVGAALQTPPFNLVLARPRDDGAIPALADALAGDESLVPGVTAALPEADDFAEAWEERSGQRRRLRMAQGLYQLTRVRTPPDVPGRPRTATEEDRELLVTWLRAFADEALVGIDSPAANAERIVDARLALDTAGFALWEDGDPVSVAGWGGRTPNGVRIGPVYTPPSLRRRGYGSAVTAAVSAERLASGLRFCFLYTDLANPTSNRIYSEIGYEPVCDSADYAFGAPDPAA
jgi:hypothetical protein